MTDTTLDAWLASGKTNAANPVDWAMAERRSKINEATEAQDSIALVRLLNDRECVYFFLAGAPVNMVKIGYSKTNVYQRLGVVQRTCPVDIAVLWTVKGADKSVEGWLHGHFWPSRVHHEWFKYSDEIRAFIEQREAFDQR